MMDSVLDSSRTRFFTGAGRFYLWAAVAFLVFVIYGSLVPFRFQALSISEALAEWQKIYPLRWSSRSDLVTNVLLFVPLSFLLMGALSVDCRRSVAVGASILVCVICGLVSLTCEFLQVYFPPRVPSLNDIVAHLIGIGAGVTLWIAAGQRITNGLRQALAKSNAHDKAKKVLVAYAAVLAFVHCVPLDLTLSPGQLFHKYREGKIVLLPFAGLGDTPIQVFQKLLWTFLWYFPVGLTLAFFADRSWRERKNWLRVFVAGLAIAGAIEFAQVFVYSRFSVITDVLAGGLAVLAGWGTALAWMDGRGSENSERRRLLWWTLLALWTLVVAFLTWQPFDFVSDLDGAGRRLQRMPILPLAQYHAGAPENAIDQLFHKTLLYGLLGMLLAVAPHSRSLSPGGRAGMAVVVGLLAAALFEFGQLFLASRHPDWSDIAIMTLGTWLGFVTTRRVASYLGAWTGAMR